MLCAKITCSFGIIVPPPICTYGLADSLTHFARRPRDSAMQGQAAQHVAFGLFCRLECSTFCWWNAHLLSPAQGRHGNICRCSRAHEKFFLNKVLCMVRAQSSKGQSYRPRKLSWKKPCAACAVLRSLWTRPQTVFLHISKSCGQDQVNAEAEATSSHPSGYSFVRSSLALHILCCSVSLSGASWQRTEQPCLLCMLVRYQHCQK